MTNWYSLAQTELIWGLLVSFKVFLGRFDNRELQNNALRTARAPSVYKSSSCASLASQAHSGLRSVRSSPTLAALDEEPESNCIEPEFLAKQDSFKPVRCNAQAEALFLEMGVHDYSACVDADGSFWFDWMVLFLFVVCVLLDLFISQIFIFLKLVLELRSYFQEISFISG